MTWTLKTKRATKLATGTSTEHTSDSTRLIFTPDGLRRMGRTYMRNEDGSLFIFGLFTFVIILITAGIGVDVIRQETLRTELQNTLDRCVLSAANISNTLDAEDVVVDCFEKAALIDYLEDVTVVDAGLGKKVTATVSAELETFFLQFAGIDNLDLFTDSSAEQGIAELEISLVLDVSGSMNAYSRLDNLAIAGQEFAETVFANSVNDSVSVSVVPYSTQVNAGETILSQLNRSEEHDTSSCLNFDVSDYNTTQLELSSSGAAKTYEQTLNFDPWSGASFDSPLQSPVCRTGNNVTILPYSNSVDDVTDMIDSLVASGNTSIDVGVKWGAALLDPSTQGITTALIDTNEVASANAGRPHDYSSTTLKVLVVMTDGVNTTQYYMPDPYRSGNSDIYVESSTNRISIPGVDEECTTKFYFNSWGQKIYYTSCSDVQAFYYPHNGSSDNDTPLGATAFFIDDYSSEEDARDAAKDYAEDNSATGSSIEGIDYFHDERMEAFYVNTAMLTWQTVWDRMTTYRHAYMRYIANDYDANVFYDWRNDTQVGVFQPFKNTRLLAACQAAKDNGILVFTIGFEAPTSSANTLLKCASSDAHYYDADGIEITEAFSAVATKITELRLVE
jgi:hypothetical protein